MVEINGKISSTMLGIEDHGIMTFSLMIEFDGSGQGFGGYALDGKAGKIGHPKSITALRKVLETVGVLKWEDLKGKYVRVRKDGQFSGPIKAIGHIVEDKWFSPEDHWKE